MSIFFLATETWFGFLLHQKRDWNKVPKTDFHTELTETSNLIFCVATRFVSPIKASVGSPTVLVQDSIEKFLIWFLYQLFDVRKRTEGCVLNQLGFQNHVSTLVEARFFPSRSQLKNFSFDQTFRLKRCWFSSFQQKAEGPKVPKCAMIFDLSRCSNSIFSEISGSICCIKIWIEFFLELSQINRLNQFKRFGFSHQRVNRKLYNCREGID